MNYKITFDFTSPVCFTDRPLFDAILAYCYAREVLGDAFGQKLVLKKEEQIDFGKMPIVQHRSGQYFLASYMFFDAAGQGIAKVRKKWDAQHDHLADFGKQKAKVQVSRGQYKSYELQINLYNIQKGWFFFESEDVSEVIRLLDKHLVGIGKKTGYGYGFFAGYTVEEMDFGFESGSVLMRPVPVSVEARPISNRAIHTGFRPPYWLPENQGLCWA